MTHSEHPAVDRATVELALQLAPDKCPDPGHSDREIWMAAGARRLATRLQAVLLTQEENYVRP